MTLAHLTCDTAEACQQLATIQKSLVLQAITVTVALIVLYKVVWFACFGPRV